MMLQRILGKFRKANFNGNPDVWFLAVIHYQNDYRNYNKRLYGICKKQQGKFRKLHSNAKKDGIVVMVSKALREVLNLRYYILAGMTGGGIYFLKLKESIPDLTWFTDVIPKIEKFNSFFNSVKLLRDGFQSVDGDYAEQKIQELQNKLYEMHAKYKEKIQKIEEENKKLRKQLFGQSCHLHPKKKIHKSLIDMYSEVMDDLSDYDRKFQSQDHLPKVVVVGDRDSGKISVLEMITQAQIFPRKYAELIDKIPIKVTVNEGPYHVAQFRDDNQEYDLTKENDLEELRNQMEYRLLRNIRQTDECASNNIVSITVEGPRLHGMVLVNLPVVTAVEDANESTEEECGSKITEHYMSNQNPIILCILNGSADTKKSKIADLVSQVDPQGKRTICVLNKVDLSECDCADPLKFQKILTGNLSPMKALGYFAVVTGRGRKNDTIRDIQQYEEDFFSNSKLFENESIRGQLTTRNLSRAVADKFWNRVKETIEQQADIFKASHFNLKTEWKNSYRGLREMDRDELFEKARGEILDEIMTLREITVKQWEEMLMKRIWEKISEHVFENIYLPSAQFDDTKMFNTSVDIKLRDWANQTLPKESVEAGWDVLRDKFSQFLLKDQKYKNRDDVFDHLKESVMQDVVSQHIWESKAYEVLRVIQLNALEDCSIQEKYQWDSAVKFLEKNLKEKLKETDDQVRNSVGPGMIERWMYWKNRNDNQNHKNAIKCELEKNINFNHADFLKTEEPMKIQNTLRENGFDTELNDIITIWQSLYKKMFYKNRLNAIANCRGHYQSDHSGMEVRCSDVVLFWRLQQMLKVTANALRQQIMNREIQHLDQEIDEILETYNREPKKKHVLLTGRRVDLAEELKRVKKIHVKLEAFIQALNKEKREKTLLSDFSQFNSKHS